MCHRKSFGNEIRLEVKGVEEVLFSPMLRPPQLSRMSLALATTSGGKGLSACARSSGWVQAASN